MPEDARTDAEILQDLADYCLWLFTEKIDWVEDNLK